MKSLSIFEKRLRNASSLARGAVLKLYLKIHGCSVGKGLKCKQFPIFRSVPNGNMIIGDHVNVGFRITFDSKADGRIVIGDFVNLTQDIIISADEVVKIGEHTLIAERVSIRDADHKIAAGTPICRQGLESAAVEVGRDVWIGAGTNILKGAYIPDGAVIGASSLVLQKSQLGPDGIYAGCPVRFLGKRDKDEQ